MTAPNAAKPAKSTPAKSTPEKDETAVVSETVKPETVENRIPEFLQGEAILAEFCKRYLGIHDEIAEYNKAVLAEKTAEWTGAKVIEKAKQLANPEDASTADKEIKAVVDEWEKVITALNLARKNVIDVTAKKLGITLSSTAERDPNIEGPLKERRKIAHTIGSQLSQIAEMTNNANASTAVVEFLSKNPLPMVGRDQTHVFNASESTNTPKYRVIVKVTKDDEELLTENGFTKAALALTNSKFGYDRGKAPKADNLREVWERALKNDANATETSFSDNGLTFTITKK